MFGALGRYVYHWRAWVLGFWLAVLVAGAGFGGQLFDRLGVVDSVPAGAESARGHDRIAELSADGPVIFALVEGVDSYSAELGDSVTGAAATIRAIPGVVRVESAYTPATDGNGRSIVVTVELAEGLPEPAVEEAEDAATVLLHQISAGSVLVGGDLLAQRAFGAQAAKDLAVGESVSLVLLVIALITILGGVLAAFLPLAVAMLGVSATLLVLLVLSTVTTVSEYSVNIVTLLGLGLAIDYSLLIIVRFSEQRAAGDDVVRSIETAMTRAGWRSPCPDWPWRPRWPDWPSSPSPCWHRWRSAEPSRSCSPRPSL